MLPVNASYAPSVLGTFIRSFGVLVFAIGFVRHAVIASVIPLHLLRNQMERLCVVTLGSAITLGK